MADEKKSGQPDSLGGALGKAQPYVDAAWQFIGAVIVGALGGWWLDRHFRTTPWLLIVGTFFGLAAGFLSFMRVIQQLDTRKKTGAGTNTKDRP